MYRNPFIFDCVIIRKSLLLCLAALFWLGGGVAASAQGTDASLSGLTVSWGTLSPEFIDTTTSYNVSVPVNFITVTPSITDYAATMAIRINGGAYDAIESDTPSAELPLIKGVNKIEVKVTAENGVTVRIYTINVTRILGTFCDSFNPALDNDTCAIAVQPNGKILLGGKFTMIGDQPHGFIGRLNADGTLDTSFNPQADSNVKVIALQSDGKILVGGEFTTLSGQECNYISRLNADGTLDTTFNPGADGTVNAIVVQADGKILVGGNFTTLAGSPCDYVGRLNADGTLDTSFNAGADGTVYAIAVQAADKKILLAGDFTHLGGFERGYIGRLNADGTLDTTFNAGADGTVNAMVLQADGKIVVGGNFSLLGGVERAYIGRLNATGTLDTTFVGTSDNTVLTLALQSDGKIVAGGAFTTLNEQPRNYIGRLIAATGTLDPTFDLGAAITDGSVTALALQADGKILVGGGFSTLGDQPRNGLGRLATENASDANLSALVVSTGTLSPAFSASGTSYNLSVFASTLNVVPTSGDSSATIAVQINGGGYTGIFSGKASAELPLDKLSNKIDLKVTAWNGNIKTYSITVNRMVASDLTALTLGSGTLSKVFASSGTTYSGSTFGSTLSLTPLSEDPTAIISVKVNGGTETIMPTGTACPQLALNPGANRIEIKVTSWNGASTTTYTLTITRLLSSNLLGLTLSSGTVSPAFSASGTHYTVTVPVDFLVVKPIVEDPSATNSVSVNGGAYTSIPCGSTSAPLPLNLGANTINVKVTGDKGSAVRIYTLEANRVKGTVCDSFNPGVNGYVSAVARQLDGKMLIGGAFTTLGGQPRQNIGRLNADGSVDMTFNPGADNVVSSLAVQKDGKILVGGAFATLSGQECYYIGRLNADGTLDASFSPDADSNVDAMVLLPDGKILVGGAFSTLNGKECNYIGRLNADGTLDASFNPSADNAVGTLVLQADGKILVGGDFGTLCGRSRAYVGRLNANGTLDSTFSPLADGSVNSIVPLADGRVLIGGEFWTVGNQACRGIAQLSANGALDMTFNPGLNGDVYSLAVQLDGKIWVAGHFTTIGGEPRNNIARLNANGSIDAAFNLAAAGDVNLLALQSDGKIWVAGRFSALGGQPRSGIARLSADGSLDATFDTGANTYVQALAVQADGKILAGGRFTSLSGTTCAGLGRLNADGSFDKTFKADLADSNAYWVRAVQADGKILVGGAFTKFKKQPRSNLARLNADGTLDLTFNPGANAYVQSIVVQTNGKILVGGGFTTLGGQPRNYIGRLNADGSVDATFNPGADGAVNAIGVQLDDKIVLGGEFTTLAGQARSHIGRLNANGTLDTTYNPGANGTVQTLILQNVFGDSKIMLGGEFTTLSGQPCKYLGRLNGSSRGEGTLDTTFNPGVNGAVNTLIKQADESILVGGAFTLLGGQRRNGIGRLVPEVSSNANLSALILGTEPLSPASSTLFRIDVPNATSSFTLTPSAADANASIQVGIVGQALTSVLSGSTSAPLPLSVGVTSLQVVVTAEDGATLKSYTVIVTRAPSANATPTGLTLSAGALTPSFSSGNTSYSLTVANSVTSTTVTATCPNATFVAQINGTNASSTASGSPCSPLPLKVGLNTINVTLKAEDGVTTSLYTITVNRLPGISGLTFSTGALTPGFAAGTNNYTLNVANAVTSTTLTPTSADGTVSVQVISGTSMGSYTVISSGSASGALPLAVGLNTINVKVTSADGATTNIYSVKVIRAPSLSGLTLSAGALTPAFSASGTSYTLSVPNSTASTTITPTSADGTIAVQANGAGYSTLPSGTASGALALHSGANTINVKVTTPDGLATNLYTITITRALSSNATLSALTLSAGALDPVFDGKTTSYSIAAANDTVSTTITPACASATFAIQVNGGSFNPISGAVPLKVGVNTIILKVTAEDGVSVNFYTITVHRAPSSNATLSGLTLSAGALNPAFTLSGTSYSMTVANSTASTTLTATCADATLALQLNGAAPIALQSGTASTPLALNVGENIIDLTVTAEDGVTVKNYTVKITRVPSLSALTLSAGPLSPAFSASGTSYTVNVANAIASTTVTPTSADGTLAIQLNGQGYSAISSGSTSDALSLKVGTNTIDIKVTSLDGLATYTYSIKIARLPSLSGLTLSAGAFTPDFNAASTSYSMDVANAVASTTVTPTSPDGTIKIKVNSGTETALPSGSTSGALPLNVDGNTVSVKVTAPDGVTSITYTVAINRARNSDATLSGLTFSAGALNPVFSSSGTAYSLTVANAVVSATVTPTRNNANASIKVGINGKPYSTVSSGTPSGSLSLAVGDNTIEVQVTAEDGTQNIYTLVVTRLPSSNVTLAGLTLSAGAISPAFSASGTSYTVNVANAVASTTVTPIPVDVTSTLQVSINGGAYDTVGAGSASSELPLTEGLNTIQIKVTAQDGVTTNLYAVKVSRAPAVSALTLSAGALTPQFSSDITSYSLTVANAVASTTVTPTASNATIAVHLNTGAYSAVESGVASAALPLSVGINTIQVKVTSPDGTTTHVYTVTITRLPGLASLKLSAGALNPAFSTNVANYSMNVANRVTSTTITPITSDGTVAVQVISGDSVGNYQTIAAGIASSPLPLDLGVNTLNIKVTARDGVTTSLYTVTITRALLLLPSLSKLTLDAGALTPAFNTKVTNYNVTVANDIASLRVTPTALNGTVELQFNDGDYSPIESGSSSGALPLNLGVNTIQLKVTGEDDLTEKIYTITVTRLQNVELSGLALRRGTLAPAFASGTTRKYSATVPAGFTTVTATAVDPGAAIQIQVNKEPYLAVDSGAESVPLALKMGANVINVKVTAEDGATNLYTIAVTRALSDDTTLSGLKLSAGTLAPLFTAENTSYTAIVANKITSVTATPTKGDSSAVTQIRNKNGSYTTIATGKSSTPQALTAGSDTPISIMVTAGDKTATDTYTVWVYRVALPETLDATEPGFDSATLEANVDGKATSYFFQYGTTTNYDTNTPERAIPEGSSRMWVQEPVSTLAPATLYHYRVVAITGTVADYGIDKTFVTSQRVTPTSLAKGDPAVGIPGAKFDTFGYPIINDNGGFAFQAVTDKKISGIWTQTEDSDSRALVVSTGTAIPGIGNFKTLGDPVFNQSGNIAFLGTLSTGVKGIWANTSGTLALVAQVKGVAPDATGLVKATGPQFAVFSELVLSNEGNVAFLASLSGAGVTAKNNQGIWRTGTNGKPVLVARTGADIAGNVNATVKIAALSIFATPKSVSGQTRNFNSNGDLIFIATLTDQTQVIYEATADGAPITAVAQKGGDASALFGDGATFAAFGSPILNDISDLALNATVTLSGSNLSGIVLESGLETLVASTGAPAPNELGETGQTGSFASFSDPVLNIQGDVSFLGTLLPTPATPNGQQGIWTYSAGNLTLLALSESAAPDVAGGQFKAFVQMAMPSFGGIVFVADLIADGARVTPANSQGIWAMDANQQLRLVARTGDVVTVGNTTKTIASIAIFSASAETGGQTRSVNSAGDLIYRVTFTDKTQAIQKLELSQSAPE